MFSLLFVSFAVLSAALFQTKASVPFDAGKGWSDDLVHCRGSLPFWLSNAVIMDNFNIFMLRLEGQSVTIFVFQVIRPLKNYLRHV